MNNIINILMDNHSILFLMLILMNIFDWLTGWLKARILKVENSVAGALGIVKKIGSWLIVFIGFMLSYAFKELGEIINIDMEMATLLGWFVLLSFIINEIRSILENLVECNIKVPKILTSGLAVVQEKMEEVFQNEKDN